MPRQVMKKRLKKDIVIPAGTIFDEAPLRIEYREGCYIHEVGLTPNSQGSITYCLDEAYKAELEEWFEDAQEWP